ncbi:MAG: hypothetical protein M3245_01865, partial [Actinomycetota bacterium]|nr:hypothetical protein [Actinomycetota bacterium]
MAFQSRDLRALLQALADDDQARAELARLIQPEDLQQVEAALRDLARAQARTERRVEELAQAQARTERRVEELAQAQARTERRIEEL